MKFKVGQKVRVRKNGTGDSYHVAGLVGVIRRINGDNSYATVFFEKWFKGWSDSLDEPRSFWGVATINLRPVRKTKRTKRGK